MSQTLQLATKALGFVWKACEQSAETPALSQYLEDLEAHVLVLALVSSCPQFLVQLMNCAANM